MADNTIIQQGTFTSTGLDQVLTVRSDVDWVEVYNTTHAAGNTQWDAVKWYWQRGMTADDGIVEYHAAASQALSMSTCATGYNGVVMRGFTLIDSTSLTLGAATAVTAGTNATQPVYSTGNTRTLQNGGIVRIQNTAHTNVNGLDFSVDAVTVNTNFRLANALQQAPGVIAGANGTWRFVAPNATVYDMFYPAKRVIANITQANPGVVTTLVDHNYVTGQQIRLTVPTACGMIELHDQLVTITRVNASTFSIGIDTSGYTAFAFPLPAAVPFTPAEAGPVGEVTTSTAALENTGLIGIILGTSATANVAAGSPGGGTGDAMIWRAGKSFNL